VGHWRIEVGAMPLFAALLLLNGCPGNYCDPTPCADDFSAQVRSVDGSFPSGTHRIDVVADGVSLSCTFVFPLAAGADGRAVRPTCDPGLSVDVAPQLECGGDLCRPIDGKFEELILLSGAPAEVRVQQVVDDKAILDVVAAPSYVGARTSLECPPVCRVASASWTLQV
jgi:hypothetical protein